MCVGGIRPFHRPSASQPSVPAWGPQSRSILALPGVDGAEQPAGGRVSLCGRRSHPQLQGYFQLTSCKGAVGGFQDRGWVLAGAGSHRSVGPKQWAPLRRWSLGHRIGGWNNQCLTSPSVFFCYFLVLIIGRVFPPLKKHPNEGEAYSFIQ